ncbi:unnamed protein product [Calypogeia fissa]
MTEFGGVETSGAAKRLKVVAEEEGRRVKSVLQRRKAVRMVNFEFAYNNPHFSDRVLHLQVSPSTGAQAHKGDEAENIEEKKMQVEKIHVSSVLLAAHSDYFMRLFSNGMSESSGIATVQITEDERPRLQELIRYMYTGGLAEPADAEETVTLLGLADRFAISSCMEPLAEALKRFPSNLHDCLLVLGLPESLKLDKAVQPVVEQYRNYLAKQFQDVSVKFEDFLSLSIEGVKVVLDSDALNVSYEEEVFQILLRWLEKNFEELEEQKQVMDEIIEVVRFPWMTGDFLVDVVAPHPLMQSAKCRNLFTEAVTFKSFTHSRQQQMIWKKTNHNRYRYRNLVILENFWGHSKTYTTKLSDDSCQVFFEFPLELVICTGETFRSRPFDLGNKYQFYLEARHGQVKTSYNQQLTCFISLGIPPCCSLFKAPQSGQCTLQYTIAMKRDYPQNYDVKQSGSLDLTATEVAGPCITFTDFFSGWFIERGFSFPRWNLTINGPVFLRLDLKLLFEDPEHDLENLKDREFEADDTPLDKLSITSQFKN